MSRADEGRKESAHWSSDRALWRRSCLTDTSEDEGSHLLDLAAFADGGLDPDDHDRVAAMLLRDPVASADVAAARLLAGGAGEQPTNLERIVERACALVPGEAEQRVVVFARPPRRRVLQGLTQWGSLAAAIALASWLGFAMGSDASRALSSPVLSSDSGSLPELFDFGSGFLRDLGEVSRT
jgi:anti-sigma factor RsiW